MTLLVSRRGRSYFVSLCYRINIVIQFLRFFTDSTFISFFLPVFVLILSSQAYKSRIKSTVSFPPLQGEFLLQFLVSPKYTYLDPCLFPLFQIGTVFTLSYTLLITKLGGVHLGKISVQRLFTYLIKSSRRSVLPE